MSCCSGSGAGTPEPLGAVAIAAGSLTNYGGTTQLAVDTGVGGYAFINVLRVKVKRTAGTAANFTPRLYSVSAALAGSISQEFVGSATAVATLFDVVATGVVFRTDAAGKFYFEPGPDAGADNAFDYQVVYAVVG